MVLFGEVKDLTFHLKWANGIENDKCTCCWYPGGCQ